MSGCGGALFVGEYFVKIYLVREPSLSVARLLSCRCEHCSKTARHEFLCCSENVGASHAFLQNLLNRFSGNYFGAVVERKNYVVRMKVN
jgi:hypothetical protein